jgi:soluble lytic murein transglycosylase-like protein
MSATISLKQTTVRLSRAASSFTQHWQLIAVLLLIFGVVNLFPSGRAALDDQAAAPLSSEDSAADVVKVAEPADLSVLSEHAPLVSPAALATVVTLVPPPGLPAAAPATLSPRMQGALDYVKRRYRVSPEALVPVFEVAQLIGKEMRIDPLLIVAIIGIESGFNPFAESSMGARGLMQIIPRFHRDKVPAGAGDGSLLDPLINIRVGVQVLEEAIRRGGGVVPGLQQYAGSSEPENLYASKVLAEKERLEQAARRSSPADALRG